MKFHFKTTAAVKICSILSKGSRYLYANKNFLQFKPSTIRSVIWSLSTNYQEKLVQVETTLQPQDCGFAKCQFPKSLFLELSTFASSFPYISGLHPRPLRITFKITSNSNHSSFNSQAPLQVFSLLAGLVFILNLRINLQIHENKSNCHLPYNYVLKFSYSSTVLFLKYPVL